MTTALLVMAGVLLVVAFALGFFLGRRTVTTGAPTPPSANAVATLDTAEDAEQAAQAADATAEQKADEVLHGSDDDTRARIAKLRARGRAGQ